ncbi:hypothetical protein PGT21_019013 [Puccinia graminis f. sp. tritici]|uniref:Uncharacterized protein n=1 Tax=Puccinia graminis f. sp. tritici TaxID=56615 RepID=A0A5B0NJJ2_PUCGR|nr:hypothetical protein PGT21_019013 [Puccinia graminis f. sp. tritici]
MKKTFEDKKVDCCWHAIPRAVDILDEFRRWFSNPPTALVIARPIGPKPAAATLWKYVN